MAVQKVVTIANPILYQPSETVKTFDGALRDLVRDMFDTMYEQHGVGLAAVQIGILKRVVVIDLESSGYMKIVMINPEIKEMSKELEFGEEGCLSVPGVTACLDRPRHVKVAYQDVFGNSKEIEGDDFMARALCHEIDHTYGKVFVDQLIESERSQVQSDIDEIKRGGTAKHHSKPAYR